MPPVMCVRWWHDCNQVGICINQNTRSLRGKEHLPNIGNGTQFSLVGGSQQVVRGGDEEVTRPIVRVNRSKARIFGGGPIHKFR